MTYYPHTYTYSYNHTLTFLEPLFSRISQHTASLHLPVLECPPVPASKKDAASPVFPSVSRHGRWGGCGAGRVLLDFFLCFDSS